MEIKFKFTIYFPPKLQLYGYTEYTHCDFYMIIFAVHEFLFFRKPPFSLHPQKHSGQRIWVCGMAETIENNKQHENWCHNFQWNPFCSFLLHIIIFSILQPLLFQTVFDPKAFSTVFMYIFEYFLGTLCDNVKNQICHIHTYNVSENS